MAFPKDCFVVPPLPGPMLRDGTVPDPPAAIPDCASIEPPPLPLEPPCPTIVSTGGHLYQVHNPSGPPYIDLNLRKDPAGCEFEFDPVVTVPCVNLSTAAMVHFLPGGRDPTATFEAIPNSQGPDDPCGWTLFLNLGLPGQICPRFSGTGEVRLVPPDDPDAGVVTVTTTNDSQSQDGCDISFNVDIAVPCAEMDVTGGTVSFNQLPVERPPFGSITVTKSGEPCAPVFTLDLELNLPFPDPHVEPVLTDLCIDADGNVHAAEVSYIQWPDADVKYKVWRSQFGYCDENRCYKEPADFLLWNTGVDSEGDALSDACQDDPHWFTGVYPSSTPAQVMASADYPGPWMPPGRRSRWVSFSCDGHEDPFVDHYFWTSFTVPGDVDPDGLALEFQVLQDNYVTEVKVNGVVIPIAGLTDRYPDPNLCDLPGPMCKFLIPPGSFVAGTNWIQFKVYNTEADISVNWVGFRLEWTGIGACGTTTTTSTTAAPTSSTTTTSGPTSSTTSGPTSSTSTTTTSTTAAPRIGACCQPSIGVWLIPPWPPSLQCTLQFNNGCSPVVVTLIPGTSGGGSYYEGSFTQTGGCACQAPLGGLRLTCAYIPDGYGVPAGYYFEFFGGLTIGVCNGVACPAFIAVNQQAPVGGWTSSLPCGTPNPYYDVFLVRNSTPVIYPNGVPFCAGGVQPPTSVTIQITGGL